VAIALLSEHLHECILVTLMNKRPSMVERPVWGGALHDTLHREIAVGSEQRLLLGFCSR
jgi:hypothetical protein